MISHEGRKSEGRTCNGLAKRIGTLEVENIYLGLDELSRYQANCIPDGEKRGKLDELISIEV